MDPKPIDMTELDKELFDSLFSQLDNESKIQEIQQDFIINLPSIIYKSYGIEVPFLLKFIINEKYNKIELKNWLIKIARNHYINRYLLRNYNGYADKRFYFFKSIIAIACILSSSIDLATVDSTNCPLNLMLDTSIDWKSNITSDSHINISSLLQDVRINANKTKIQNTAKSLPILTFMPKIIMAYSLFQIEVFRFLAFQYIKNTEPTIIFNVLQNSKIDNSYLARYTIETITKLIDTLRNQKTPVDVASTLFYDITELIYLLLQSNLVAQNVNEFDYILKLGSKL